LWRTGVQLGVGCAEIRYMMETKAEVQLRIGCAEIRYMGETKAEVQLMVVAHGGTAWGWLRGGTAYGCRAEVQLGVWVLRAK